MKEPFNGPRLPVVKARPHRRFLAPRTARGVGEEYDTFLAPSPGAATNARLTHRLDERGIEASIMPCRSASLLRDRQGGDPVGVVSALPALPEPNVHGVPSFVRFLAHHDEGLLPSKRPSRRSRVATPKAIRSRLARATHRQRPGQVGHLGAPEAFTQPVHR